MHATLSPRIDLGDRYYQFDVDDEGVVKGIVHVP